MSGKAIGQGLRLMFGGQKVVGIQLLLPPLVGFSISWIFWGEGGQQWTDPDLWHPLGTDEFGRDILGTILAATGLSVVKGFAVTLTTLSAAVVVAELVTVRAASALSALVRIASSIIESVPVVLWVFIALIAVHGPRPVVVGVVFTLVVLPIATHVLAGEFLRLRSTFYVEAAYLLGVGELRIVMRHILPNAVDVLLPFAIQVLGAAIAVDGAIGVIGLGNRSDLDLGMFLLRGRENFFLHPQVLMVALAAYALIYGYLMWAGAVVMRALRRAAGSMAERAPVETSLL